MEEVIFKGREACKTSTPALYDAKPDHCYVFSYTSGTTGDPKGVKISHEMMLGQQYACQVRLDQTIKQMNENDSYISYLPGAHSFEQGLIACCMIFGMKSGFFAGNILKLTEDIGVLKPTLFPSVPRLYNRIFGKIQDGLK